ncbi:MAG: hypothetical protein H6506_02135 [Calditrichaeota bacterium]|nr:hypothetical protein [Calditrichota bacterium]
MVLGILTSCSAPHDNPLDPESANYVAPIPPEEIEPVPTFQARVRSVHTARLFPTTDSYSVLTELWPDSAIQIDSVKVHYDSRAAVRMSLTNEGRWAATFTSSYFQDDYLESVVGQPFDFLVHSSKDSHEVGPVYLFRVLQATPVVTSPDSNQVVGHQPQFNWEPFSALFPFRYQVALDRILDFSIVARIWASDTLSSNQRIVQYPDSLEDDDYYWTLYVYDEFTNSSRSREGYFVVEATP